jgi:hypothetical protein
MVSLFGTLLRPETLVLTVTFPGKRTYYTKVAPLVSIDWPLSRCRQVSAEEAETREGSDRILGCENLVRLLIKKGIDFCRGTALYATRRSNAQKRNSSLVAKD